MATKKRKVASRRPGPGKRTRVERGGELAALNRSQMVLELALDGTILGANDNFLQVLGYGLREVKGKNHGLFVDPAEHGTVEYDQLWEKLARGEHDAGQYKRLSNTGEKSGCRAPSTPSWTRRVSP